MLRYLPLVFLLAAAPLAGAAPADEVRPWAERGFVRLVDDSAEAGLTQAKLRLRLSNALPVAVSSVRLRASFDVAGEARRRDVEATGRVAAGEETVVSLDVGIGEGAGEGRAEAYSLELVDYAPAAFDAATLLRMVSEGAAADVRSAVRALGLDESEPSSASRRESARAQALLVSELAAVARRAPRAARPVADAIETLFAIRALGAIGGARDVPALVDALGHERAAFDHFAKLLRERPELEAWLGLVGPALDLDSTIAVSLRALAPREGVTALVLAAAANPARSASVLGVLHFAWPAPEDRLAAFEAPVTADTASLLASVPGCVDLLVHASARGDAEARRQLPGLVLDRGPVAEVGGIAGSDARALDSNDRLLESAALHADDARARTLVASAFARRAHAALEKGGADARFAWKSLERIPLLVGSRATTPEADGAFAALARELAAREDDPRARLWLARLEQLVHGEEGRREIARAYAAKAAAERGAKREALVGAALKLDAASPEATALKAKHERARVLRLLALAVFALLGFAAAVLVARSGRGAVREGACERCGTVAPVVECAFRSQVAYLVSSRTRRTEGALCRACVRRAFVTHSLLTLLAGWWGIAAFFRNASILGSNAYHLVRAWHVPGRSAAAGDGPRRAA